MGRNGVKTERFYMRLYMSIFKMQKFNHPAQIVLNETLYVTNQRLALYFRWNLTLILAY